MLIEKPKELIDLYYSRGNKYCAVGWLGKCLGLKSKNYSSDFQFEFEISDRLNTTSFEVLKLRAVNDFLKNSEERIELLGKWLKEHGHDYSET